MRIGKITLDGYFNYGNVLQNYALNHVLEEYSDKVDNLWYSQQSKLPNYWQKLRPWNWKTYVKFLLNWKGFRHQLTSGLNDWEVYRNARIKIFCDKYINIRYVNDLSSVEGEYDYFVTGSDQVWNPFCDDLDNTFLLFAPEKKRLSYAASIAAVEIPENKAEFYKRALGEMAQISVREADGAHLIAGISGRKAMVHIDPTLLLNEEEWSKLESKPKWLMCDDYIVTYFLGKRPDNVLKKLSDRYDMPVINMLDEKYFDHYTISPEEWIYLIHHSKLMYTDSFHGTVFSILFKTPFVVCNRLGSKLTERMTSRIDTLLSLTGITGRRGTSDNGYEIDEPMSICWPTDMEKRLLKERQRSHDYFSSIFNIRLNNI